MKELEVVVVGTGTANLASILAGFRRAGAKPRISNNIEDVASARAVVLPGVGALAAAMVQLNADGLVEPLKARVRAGRPTLAVCLGLQLLCEYSDESPGVAGLGIIPADIKSFPEGIRTPHFGWNQVEPTAECRLLQPGYAYFANSFRLPQAPEGWNVAYTDYAGPFVGAMENGAVLACQFHPELSGDWGLDLLKRWLSRAEEEGN